MARTSATLVATAAAPAANGSASSSAGRDRLAAQHEPAVAVRDDGAVVAVEGERQAIEQAQLALGLQAGRGADDGGEMSEIGHDASASVLQRVRAVNVGLSSFADAVRVQGAEVVDVDWRPPGDGEAAVVALLERAWGAHGERVEAANAAALGALEGARPHVLTVAPAGEVIEGLEGRTLLHAGPPIDWERVCDPQRRALVAACLLEGWAADASEAQERLDVGEVRLRCGNECGHVGPMTGVCSPSMPVWVVQDEGTGTRAFSTLNEGPGRTLWFGVGDDEAIERARFLRDRAGPLLARLLRAHRADRRPRPRRPGAADGRRAAHAQPGDDEPALAPAAAGLRGRGRGGRRRRRSPATTSSS